MRVRDVDARRVLGFAFVIAAMLGIIFSVVALIEMWIFRPALIRNVMDNLSLFDQALSTTQDGLTVMDQTVQSMTVDVDTLQATTESLNLAIQDTNTMLDSMSTLTSTDVPNAIKSIQTSLTSAQNSALLIDTGLSTLTSIPFLDVSAYKPEVPLHTALANVSTSLNALTPSLVAINSSLVEGRNTLADVDLQLKTISETTREMKDSLDKAQLVIDQYKSVTTRLQSRVDSAQASAPAWINAFVWLVSFVLFWLMVAQLGLGVQGVDMIRDRREHPRL
jgi:hypothetical protein